MVYNWLSRNQTTLARHKPSHFDLKLVLCKPQVGLRSYRSCELLCKWKLIMQI